MSSARFLIFIFLLGCESITGFIEGDNYFKAIERDSGKENLSLIFSHNINGELEPCGCRHHPLGGLSQVSGFLHQNKEKSINFYVDTGDTFFPSSKIPASLEKSFKYTASTLADSLDQLGLKYMVPGDQDFAAGLNFLDNIAKKHSFSFLISNLKKKVKLKHQKIALHAFGNREFIFIGLINPSIMNQYQNLFEDPVISITRIFKQNPEYKKKEVILLSHMGMNEDKLVAKKFPFIKWIIGAHSQSFLKEPTTVAETKIVQVLSRNHYLGKIDFKANLKMADQFEIIEMRQKWEKELKDNPFIPIVQNYRTELNKIQQSEQENLLVDQTDKTVYKLPTAASCISCHSEQSKFWQKTAHSLAFQTLRDNKADANPSCVGCHSLGYQKENGFISATNIVQFEKTTDLKAHQKKIKDYFKQLDTLFKKDQSIREMSPKKRSLHSQAWLKLDTQNKVTHNFANVQCLNCHAQSIDHPFDDSDNKNTAVDTNRCLGCHTPDQSPKWYKNSEPGKVNGRILKSMLSNIACPKMKP